MIQVIEIETAFATWLMSSPASSLARVRRLAKMQIREMLANAVFSAHLPPNAHKYGHGCELAATLRTQGADREYILATDFQDGDEPGGVVGESKYCQAVLNVIYHARGSAQPKRQVKRLAEFVRLATTQYQGVWSYAADDGESIDVTIDSATLISEGDLPPAAGTKTAERWQARYQHRWLVTFDQTPVITQPSAARLPTGEPVPPPPPPTNDGIGTDTVGDTQVL